MTPTGPNTPPLTRLILFIDVAMMQATVGIYDPRTGRYRKIKESEKGKSDIIACIRGEFWGIEIKFDKDRTSAYQELFRQRIEQGKVEPERESTRGNYFFRLSYALQFDATEVKGKKRNTKINK